jgi:hypothetical protein
MVEENNKGKSPQELYSALRSMTWTVVLGNNLYDDYTDIFNRDDHPDTSGFKNSFFNILENGYDSTRPIVIEKNNQVQDGKHRTVDLRFLNDVRNGRRLNGTKIAEALRPYLDKISPIVKVLQLDHNAQSPYSNIIFRDIANIPESEYESLKKNGNLLTKWRIKKLYFSKIADKIREQHYLQNHIKYWLNRTPIDLRWRERPMDRDDQHPKLGNVL